MDAAANVGTWDRIFSAENFFSYIRACHMLYTRLQELEGDGFTTLVYPSRGTTPFADLVKYTHQLRSDTRGANGSIQNVLRLPFWRATIELPFTADWRGDPNASASIRDYWVQVLHAMLHGNLTSVALRYYQYTLDKLFGFSPSHGCPLHRPSPKFVFVDTVVSGRAVHEIVTAFARHGLTDFHLVLLIDEMGGRLRSPYRETIDKLERQGRLTRILLASIFTEDRGPAVTSTWCLTVPQLALRVPALIGTPMQGPAGTAVSFVRVQYGQELSNLSTTMLGGMLFHTFQAYLGAPAQSTAPPVAEQSRQQLVQKAAEAAKNGNDPLSSTQTKRIAQASINHDVSIALGRRPISFPVVGLEVSNSHVLRLEFRDRDVDRFMRDFDGHPAEAIWFRHL